MLQKICSTPRNERILLAVTLSVYGVLSASFLTRFPLVHSDESWLAGLSRDMMHAHSLAVTESFFDAKVRYPHAIKCLFHLLQQLFLFLFGYSPFTVRLLSLCAALLFLWMFYYLLKTLTHRALFSYALMLIVAFDTQFIYASHMARQEIFLLVLFAGLYLLFLPAKKHASSGAAILCGIGIGFHPNALLLAAVCVCVLLSDALFAEKESPLSVRIRPLAIYLSLTACFALFFILLSNSFTPHFLKNYFAYGAKDFGLDAGAAERLTELFGFFKRLFAGESGTYLLPQQKTVLILLPVSACAVFVSAIRKKDASARKLLSGLLGLLAGTYLIGRYNQLSILFFYFFCYLLCAYCLTDLPRPARKAPTISAFAFAALLSIIQIRPYLRGTDYDDFTAALSRFVPKDAKVIANLNANFYFDRGKLIDLRNLPYVMEKEGTLARYVREHEIEYIVFSTELDYLYAHRPYYNVIYGNATFVPALKQICEEEGTLAGSFTDLRYGARVKGLIGEKEWCQIFIYRLEISDDG